MDTDELKKRIARFRTEYLDTAEGRQILQRHADEPKEVQPIYLGLRKTRDAGQDITDEALRTLLPYANTKGNRDRGARVSTWPCITKDIKSWFEGANWKKSSDWPAVVDWLLEIIETGRVENWEIWQSLAKQPIQKGFACGFITPVVHCLNLKLPIINSKVVKTFYATATALGLNAEISSALEEYPDNQKKLLDFIAKLGSFGIADLDEWDTYCHWNVAKSLGGNGKSLPKPVPPEPPSPLAIVEELRAAQYDTKNYKRLESALAAAFQLLGFEAEHIGGSGEEDVTATGLLGEDGYSIVIDAKTVPRGTSKSAINYAPLTTHQEEYEADFAIVVAAGFSQGDTIQHAVKQGVGLLTTECLIELIEAGHQQGISLYLLKEVFSQKGLITPNLEKHLQTRRDLLNAMHAVLATFERHQRAEEASACLTVHAVYWLLKGSGNTFSEKYVEDAIDLLANPLVGVLAKKESGYVLIMPAAMATIRMAFIATAAKTTEPNNLEF